MNLIFKNFVTDTNIIIIPSFYLYMYFIYHLKFIKFHFFNSICKNWLHDYFKLSKLQLVFHYETRYLPPHDFRM